MQEKSSLTPTLAKRGQCIPCVSLLCLHESINASHYKKRSTECFGYACMVQQHRQRISFSAAMSSKLFLVLLFLVAFSELCVCTELRSTADQVGETPPSKNLDSSPPGGPAIDGITHSAFLKAGYGDSLLGGPRKFHQHQQQRPNCPKGCRELPGLHVCCGASGCKNILKNRYHCGACHRPCPFGQACCEGFCVDTMNDENHCGRCGMACAPGVACIFGLCGYSLG